MPEVSVIIPAYNAEKFIAQTLECVLAQTFRDFEVIVVNDGSKDRTGEVAERFGAPVRCVSKNNEGVSIARNTGVRISSGKYIAFLDADDLWDATKLEKQVALLDARQEIGLCFTGAYRVSQSLQILGEIPARDYPDYCQALLLYSCVVTGSCSSAMLRRELTEQAGGFDREHSTCADWDYWLRLSRITRFAPIPEPLVMYRVTTGSMSSDPALVERDTLAALNKFFSKPLPEKYLELKNRSYSNHWIIFSGDYLHAGQLKESLRGLREGLGLYPPNVIKPAGMPVRWLKRRLLPGLPF